MAGNRGKKIECPNCGGDMQLYPNTFDYNREGKWLHGYTCKCGKWINGEFGCAYIDLDTGETGSYDPYSATGKPFKKKD